MTNVMTKIHSELLTLLSSVTTFLQQLPVEFRYHKSYLMSELSRNYADFLFRARLLTNTLLEQGYVATRLKKIPLVHWKSTFHLSFFKHFESWFLTDKKLSKNEMSEINSITWPLKIIQEVSGISAILFRSMKELSRKSVISDVSIVQYEIIVLTVLIV